jgi:hypothetical protein
MQEDFESIVPMDWGPVDSIEIGTTMVDWPTKREKDIAWVYIGIGGDVYSEAVVVIVTEEENVPKVREVEWGRP